MATVWLERRQRRQLRQRRQRRQRRRFNELMRPEIQLSPKKGQREKNTEIGFHLSSDRNKKT